MQMLELLSPQRIAMFKFQSSPPRYFRLHIAFAHSLLTQLSLLHLASLVYFSHSLSMASCSTVPSVSDMVELRAHGLGVPILFPVAAEGFATVSVLHLSIRFSLQESIIWVEREIYDSATSLLSMTN
jgi:hypothetical protein